jgi:hypothetical protein
LATGKLGTKHGIDLAKETVRRLQIAAGLWIPRKLWPPKIQQPRLGRACIGELVQIDGCEHHDDATSRLQLLRFVEGESTFDYMQRLIGKYIDVLQFPDGLVEIRAGGQSLPYSTYDRVGVIDQGAVVDHKRLSHALQAAQLLQVQRDHRYSLT